MKKEEFSFDSRDGHSRIHAVRWVPEGEIKAVLQIIHGMAEYIDRYEAFAAYLTQQGVLVTGEDHLGHGKTVTENGSLQGYFCPRDPATVIIRDVHRLKKITQELYPEVPYFILGHSMGSFMARNYMLRYGKGIDGVIIMGTGVQTAGMVRFSKVLAALQGFFQGQKHPSQMLEKLSFGSYLDRIQTSETAFDWLSVNRENVNKYVADPMCGFTFTVNGYRTILDLLGRLTDQSLLERIPPELPVLLVSGEEDPVGNYGEAVKTVEASLLAAGIQNVKKKLYTGDRHEILNEDDREEVYQDIYQWIEECRKTAEKRQRV